MVLISIQKVVIQVKICDLKIYQFLNVYIFRSGKTRIPAVHQPPTYIANLLERKTEPPQPHKLFFANPRGFNTSVSFASTKTTDYHFVTPGLPTMRINGRINHAYGYR